MSEKPVDAHERVHPDPVRSGRRDPATIIRRLTPVITPAAVFGLLLGMIIVAFAPSTDHDSDNVALGGKPVAAVKDAGPFEVELADVSVTPKAIEVPAGAKIHLKVRNTGKMDHSLELDGKGGPMLKPGESRDITWEPLTASTKAWCTVAGHKESGMVMDVRVTGGSGAKQTGGSGDHGDSDGAGNDKSAKIDFAAKPGSDWRPYDPAVKPAPGGTEHKATFNVEEKEQEVAPGVKQMRWTFNGQVPGPTLRGKIGDVFTVTLVNKGSMAHSIDFHASKVAPNVEMRPIKPGESLVYQFKAQFAGIFYYHCGTDPMLHHIANGMYGALIVDPPDLPKVDRELIVEQAELYLGESGKPGDLTKMMAAKPDAVVFNGYVNQYVYAPVKVNKGERVRVWVLNAGINEVSSFHVIGSIFDTVYKEGSFLLRPDARKGGSQALDLLPAQGGFVEFTLDRDGTYPFVSHKMASAHTGAMGIFQVGDGK